MSTTHVYLIRVLRLLFFAKATNHHHFCQIFLRVKRQIFSRNVRVAAIIVRVMIAVCAIHIYIIAIHHRRRAIFAMKVKRHERHVQGAVSVATPTIEQRLAHRLHRQPNAFTRVGFVRITNTFDRVNPIQRSVQNAHDDRIEAFDALGRSVRKMRTETLEYTTKQMRKIHQKKSKKRLMRMKWKRRPNENQTFLSCRRTIRRRIVLKWAQVRRVRHDQRHHRHQQREDEILKVFRIYRPPIDAKQCQNHVIRCEAIERTHDIRNIMVAIWMKIKWRMCHRIQRQPSRKVNTTTSFLLFPFSSAASILFRSVFSF